MGSEGRVVREGKLWGSLGGLGVEVGGELEGEGGVGG